SMARPGGNATGFITHEFGFAGKWLELLKEIAPWVTRAAVMRDSAISSQIALFGSIQSVAPSLGVELRPIDSRDPGEIERAVSAFAERAKRRLDCSAGRPSDSAPRSDHYTGSPASGSSSLPRP